MPRAGVICEFNPFHNGHKFLLKKIKAAYADEIVCIMSGNFVQRGETAITDKYARTKAALENGADLVVELPTVYASASARLFAENGVRIAAALHCDRLCFGAENSIEELYKVTDKLDSQDIQAKIADLMKEGEYYPRALSLAIGEDLSALIEKPNNILALEYIRACRLYGIVPVAIPRIGVEHDALSTEGVYTSATNLRGMILRSENYRRFTPMEIHNPCTLDALEPVILYRLKTKSADELRTIAEVSEGLENRILEAAKQSSSLTKLFSAVKTKRYTMARLRRIMIHVLLGITAELQSVPVPYIRVLGVSGSKEYLFGKAKLPLIIKTKRDCAMLDATAKDIFDVDLRAAEAMNIARGQTPINEFSQKVLKV